MPCFRGIDVFIGTESELERLPEFPHPDSASVSLVPRHQPTSSPQSQSSSTHSSTERSPASMAKANPRVSVYIPSLPGIRFWIQYSITQVPALSSHLYFKLFANGANVTSWGIDPSKTTTGTVAKGLYEPDASWHYQDEGGDVFKRDGIESRLFHFAEGPENEGPENEKGGVIEVQVFRAKGRRRCAPRLELFGSLDEYGILSPSGGLLEHPEDAAFYDWLLLDPKESPYATFRFYYRSWATLRCLNVIPPSRTSSTPGCFPYGGLEGAPTTPTISKRSSEQLFNVERSTVVPHDDTTEKVGDKASSSPDGSPSRGFRAPFPLTSPPEVLQARSSSPCLPQPSKKTRDGFLDRGLKRPLPALPSRPSRLRTLPPGVSAPTNTPEKPMRETGAHDVLEVGIDLATHSPLFPPGPLVPRPLSLSPKGYRRMQEARASTPTPEERPRRFSPPPKLSASPERATKQTRQDLGRRTTSPSPPSKDRTGTETEPQSPPRHKPTPTKTPVDRSQSPTPKPSSPKPGIAPPPFGLDGNGIPTLPRGLLGPALTEIPLRGPTGELMKRLRSEDPFRDD